MADQPGVRLAEIVGTLALAQDGAFGQPADAQLRAAMIAAALAERLGLDSAQREAVRWAAPLRYLGCTSHAHDVAVLFGDEIEFRAHSLLADPSNPIEMLRDVVTRGGGGRAPADRVRMVLSMLAGGREPVALSFRTACEVGDKLATRLGVPEAPRKALRFGFERWNGRGFPDGVKGEEIPLPMRVIHVACDAEVLARVHGSEHALDVLRRRSGRAYDPDVVAAFAAASDVLLASAETADPWDAWLEQDDPEPAQLDDQALDRVLEVVADFADLKSPFTPGHSRGVAKLAADAGQAGGLTAEDITMLRRAALVHDLGRVCVPNSIWDKPGPLTRTERERMELHPVRTEQLLARSPGLRALAPAAGAHHERVDGTGYPHHASAAGLPPAARMLAAADRLHAMTEERPYRAAHSADAAADQLRAEARNGGVDPDAAAAVLAAAGQVTGDRRAAQLYPDGLTAREVEVLRLLARGQTTKQIALALVISVKTADRHIQNAYGKIGASTRGAATLYAIERGLAQPRRDGP
jgi:HD-GYP domain-containing protein (c-di-GMP phosphodiesterase class II)/DNA-binding CsgD family transcriptional regulator